MSRLLGRQAPSKPVTASDRSMSERHLERRRAVDGAPHTSSNLRRSIAYNAEHRDEHDKAMKKAQKELEKARKEASK